MKRKQLGRKIAFWLAGITALTVCCIVTPKLINVTGADMEISQTDASLPKISIDSQCYDINNAPYAVVGKDYRIFNASAKDNHDNDLKVYTRVWIYYYSTTKSRIELKDGVFKPIQSGEYVVEYTATDSDGKKAVVIYPVKCIDRESLNVSLGDKEQAGVAGISMNVANINVENAVGDCAVQITAKLKNGNDNSVISEDLSFRPMYAGTYVIEYSCTDYVETVTTSYEIQVAKNDKPVFIDNPVLQKYFIQDKEYRLPIPAAYHFAYGTPVQIDPVITVSYTDKTSVILTGNAFTPVKSGEIELTYSIAYGNNFSTLKYNAVVKDVEYGENNSYDRYFYAPDYSVTMNKESVSFFTMTSGATADFINPILTKRANIVFSADTRYRNYDALDLYLTDSLDSSVQVKISFRDKESGGTYYRINDKNEFSVSASFLSGKKLSLSYKDNLCAVNINDTLNIVIRETLAGEEFQGFPSGKMYVAFTMVGVDGPAGFTIRKLNNQSFNSNAMDSVPEIVFTKHEGGEMRVGDIVELNPFYVGDVLDNECIVEYYVLDPAGNYVTALDGTVLNGKVSDYSKTYSIVMDMAGIYNVCMNISDTLGNEQLYAYGITAIDRTMPTIRFTPKIVAGKVGDEIEVAKATAADMSGKELKYYVYVYSPDGRIVNAEGGAFLAELAGKYTVYYHVFDANGNTDIQYYDIVVS